MPNNNPMVDNSENRPKFCSHCGSPITGNYCAECGSASVPEPQVVKPEQTKEDPKKAKIKRNDRIILALMVIAAVVTLPWWLPMMTGDDNSSIVDKYSKLSLNELKSQSKQVLDVSTFARNPEGRIGELVNINGKILQSQMSGDNYVLRISAGSGSYEGSSEAWINYKLRPGYSRPLEGDRVDVYGVFTGIKTYQTVLGSSRSIPEVTAFYI